MFIGWFIVLFGCIEYIIDRQVWPLLNIEMLWAKKGLPNMASWGLPLNFFSSEKIFGEQVRRMASSYADPVNFGAVMFLVIVVAWYAKKYLLMWLGVLCAILAISKAALVGFLVLITVWSYYYLSKSKFIVILGMTLSAGMAFLVYSNFHSTQSVGAHVEGLWSAVNGLSAYPLGRGLGNVGVLSGADGEIKESGLGVLIGQLGIIGILLYGYFFTSIIRRAFKVEDVRQRVFVLILIGSILINISNHE